MTKVVFRKTMENVRKHGDIKFATSEKRRNYLVSEPNYHTTIFVSNRNEKNADTYEKTSRRFNNIIIK